MKGWGEGRIKWGTYLFLVSTTTITFNSGELEEQSTNKISNLS